jgi:serine/threonine protein kinase
LRTSSAKKARFRPRGSVTSGSRSARRWRRRTPAASCIATSSRRTFSSDKEGADWVKIVDVAIAKLLESPGEEIDVSTLTREGSIVGTPAYFSPEQARGQVELDGRRDL